MKVGELHCMLFAAAKQSCYQHQYYNSTSSPFTPFMLLSHSAAFYALPLLLLFFAGGAVGTCADWFACGHLAKPCAHMAI